MDDDGVRQVDLVARLRRSRDAVFPVVAADFQESCFGGCGRDVGVDAVPCEPDVFADLGSGIFVAESEHAKRDLLPRRVQRGFLGIGELGEDDGDGEQSGVCDAGDDA